MVNFNIKIMVGIAGVALIDIHAKTHAEHVETIPDPVELMRSEIINSGWVDWYEWLSCDKPQKEGVYLMTGVATYTDDTAEYDVTSVAPIPYTLGEPIIPPDEKGMLTGKALQTALADVYHESLLPDENVRIDGRYSLVGIDIAPSPKENGRFMYWVIDNPHNAGLVLLGENVSSWQVDDLVTIRQDAIDKVSLKMDGDKAGAAALVDAVIAKNGAMLDRPKLDLYAVELNLQ